MPSGAAVVGRSADDAGGSLGGSSNRGGLWIAVEVSAAAALELASVIDADDFVMVRSTGATPGAVGDVSTVDDFDPSFVAGRHSTAGFRCRPRRGGG